MQQQTFFGGNEDRPLASRMRPRTLDEFTGQGHLLGEGKILRQLIDAPAKPFNLVTLRQPGIFRHRKIKLHLSPVDKTVIIHHHGFNAAKVHMV